MISALIRFALTQRLLTLLLAAGAAALGVLAFSSLPIDAFPDVSPSQVKIIIKAPGMTPEEIETRITAPIEVELLGIPRQSTLRSITKYALTDITVDFDEATDIYWARQQVAERLSAVWEDLPAGIEGGIAPMTTPLGEMFMFTVDGAGDLAARRALLDWTIRPALRTVPGVADVNALGGYVRSFEVAPDAQRLAALGISNEQLEAALARNNANDGAGRVNEGENTLLVRSLSRVQSLKDVRSIVVAQRSDMPVTVADVAEVRIGSIARYGAVTQNGQHETVQGLVLGLRGANAERVVAGVRAKLEEIRPALPAGVSINVFYDRGTLVERAVGTVSRALLEATVLVLVLLVLFLGEVRAALAVAMVLPLAALITFVVMDRVSMSANLMSLGGLAIAIGMLVDAAVVVVENIASSLARPEARRHARLHVIYRAVREVSVPMTSGIGIIIVVFLPLLTLEGLEGKLFSQVALTIVFALTGSLLLSLTVIPVLASFLLGEQAHAEPWLPARLQRTYQPLLRWSLANPRWPVGVGVLAMLAAAAVFPFIGRTFLPTMDEGDIIVQLEKLPSITLEESVHLDERVEAAILAAVPEVTRMVARVGSDEIGMDPMGLNETDVFMVLAPRDTWRVRSKAELQARIRDVLDGFPGIAYGFTQPIEMRTSEMLTGVRGDVAVKIFGADLGVLNDRAQAVADTLRGISGSEDVFITQNEGVQYLELAVDRRQLGRFGLDAQTLQRALRAQVEGLQVGIVQEGRQRTPLMLRAEADGAVAAERLADLPVAVGDGRYVLLRQLAEVRRVDGVVAVSRESGQRFAVVRTNVAGRDLVGFVDEARRTVANEVALPAGYYLEWGGEFENQQRAAARLTLVVPVALVLIFLLLFSTFRSIRQALLILSNIPFALIGGVFALALSGEYLSVPASVGFIALLGIAVLNGVVMVSCINQLREAGMDLREAVLEGAGRRLRPVMMTASIAAIGLVPLLFAQGPGSEIQRPLAIVVIGGLVTATALTLVVLPILYDRFGSAQEAAP